MMTRGKATTPQRGTGEKQMTALEALRKHGLKHGPVEDKDEVKLFLNCIQRKCEVLTQLVDVEEDLFEFEHLQLLAQIEDDLGDIERDLEAVQFGLKDRRKLA
jgi:hypothetical protein